MGRVEDGLEEEEQKQLAQLATLTLLLLTSHLFRCSFSLRATGSRCGPLDISSNNTENRIS